MTPETEDSIITHEAPEKIAFVKRDPRTSVYQVISRGKRLTHYHNERSAKALAQYINDLNEQIMLHPESAAQICESAEPNVPLDTH